MQNIKELADLLQKSKRETDILGYLGENRLALLLPDTSKDGVQAVIRNRAEPGSRLVVRTTVGTYPDQLFDSLISAHQVPDRGISAVAG